MTAPSSTTEKTAVIKSATCLLRCTKPELCLLESNTNLFFRVASVCLSFPSSLSLGVRLEGYRAQVEPWKFTYSLRIMESDLRLWGTQRGIYFLLILKYFSCDFVKDLESGCRLPGVIFIKSLFSQSDKRQGRFLAIFLSTASACRC